MLINVLRHLTYNLGQATRMVYDGSGVATDYVLDEMRHTSHEYRIHPVMQELTALLGKSKGTPQYQYYKELFNVLNSSPFDSQTCLSRLLAALPEVNRRVRVLEPVDGGPT